MKNLNVKDTIQKNKKTKSEIKKEHEESIAGSKRNANTDMQEKVNNCTTNEEDAVKGFDEVSLKNLKILLRTRKAI